MFNPDKNGIVIFLLFSNPLYCEKGSMMNDMLCLSTNLELCAIISKVYIFIQISKGGTKCRDSPYI